VTLVGAAAVVVDGRVCRPGWLHTCGDRIADCGPGAPPRSPDVDFPGAVLVPGFVDMHVHGGDGASYPDADPAATTRAAGFHRRHGTTTTLASLVTAAPGALLDAVSVLAELTRRGVVAGIHLEGPWLSRHRCGAHDRTQLRDPDPAEIDALLAAGAGTIRMVTLAPERPGSSAAIRRFVEAGVVVAVGHTDAGYEQTRAAIAAGATVGTHLFNAMRPLHQRAPGPALALLEDPRVIVELIGDGVHLHPALLRRVIDTAGADRVALISDATAAAGARHGSFRLGAVPVEVVSGAAYVSGTSTIAGSTATMDRVFRAVAGSASSDAALTAAVQMTSTTPARALGFDHVGSLRPGYRADLVVLDQDLHIVDVMAGGDWLARKN
jgi:N-acetylglucosamine-6-phosphate deacetylase